MMHAPDYIELNSRTYVARDVMDSALEFTQEKNKEILAERNNLAKVVADLKLDLFRYKHEYTPSTYKKIAENLQTQIANLLDKEQSNKQVLKRAEEQLIENIKALEAAMKEINQLRAERLSVSISESLPHKKYVGHLEIGSVFRFANSSKQHYQVVALTGRLAASVYAHVIDPTKTILYQNLRTLDVGYCAADKEVIPVPSLQTNQET